MKTLKKIGAFLLVIITLLIIIVGVFAYTLKPDYSGEKELVDLQKEVTVYYDEYGIPHIYGENEKDAFRTLGYVHAQDRLWQMELLRRIASGGLSEVFGADLIGTDKFFLSLGIADASKISASNVNDSDAGVILSKAYLDGINQFINEGPTPVEFYLTGIEKKEFVLEDIYNTIGYMAFSFAMAHKTDPLLTTINTKLGTEYLKDLYVGSSTETEWIKNYNPSQSDSIQDNLTTAVNKALGVLDIPLFEGSNSWVIAPEKTKNGKVILANDPHIGFSQPSVWYEAHVEAPTYSKYGYHIAGIPFPLLGHNRKLAYGITMFENDDVDFYYEQNNPENENQYLSENGYVDYEIITKKFKVKDSSEINFSYKKSNHGPILNGIADQVQGERPIAMSWLYTQMDNKVIDALFGLSHSNNLTEFKAALPKIHAPGLNIMYGDDDGNVAWFATAQLYKIPDSINTKLIFEVGEGLPVEKEFIGFNENPQAINPPSNYVYSANNQPDSIAGMLYPGYYLPENRGKRIVQLLEPKNDWDLNAASEMITDVISAVDPEIVTNLSKYLDVSLLSENGLKAIDSLKMWKGGYELSSIEATIYNRWVYYFLENTFEDELEAELFKQFLGTHFTKRLIAPLSKDEESVWLDNVNTTDVQETMADIVNMSFMEAVFSLEKDFGKNMDYWQWERVHSIEHPHPIGQIAALRSFFNVGPFPVNGTREVINNQAFSYDATGFYKTTSGPSTRRIIDFSDVENSISILPTGQSGNPFSKHYRDQAEMYVNGEFRKMMMNKIEIQKSKEILTFKPKD
ncbi:penicillin acylase family protein [Maribacter sp. 1_MG-2023]|uniref:penicillin acylase family protein n=1 Tax=Maribacter sp. 1_MG-2023 TaxID=3062677 RepID=UPI0026E4794B|nr:penicillin acylase family protein [Maribacter sp. 1_MG-2023]MDO6471827.1 penicillin acylase family protein [Maribacter sp. 1_MG-2023]